MVDYRQIESMLTVRDVARLLHIHRNTVRRWSDQKIIRSYRINSRGDRRFKLVDIAHLLTEMTEKGSNAKKASRVAEYTS